MLPIRGYGSARANGERFAGPFVPGSNDSQGEQLLACGARRAPAGLALCEAHWFMVPPPLRQAIQARYHPG